MVITNLLVLVAVSFFTVNEDSALAVYLKEKGIKVSSSRGLFGMEPVLGYVWDCAWECSGYGFPWGLCLCPILLREGCKMGAIQALSQRVFLTGISSLYFFYGKCIESHNEHVN